MPALSRTEDFEAFESAVTAGGKALLSTMVGECLEEFDESLRRSMPEGWSARCRASRKPLTPSGRRIFLRTLV